MEFLSIEEECASTYINLGMESPQIELRELLWAPDGIEAPPPLQDRPVRSSSIVERQSTRRQLVTEVAEVGLQGCWYVTLEIYLELRNLCVLFSSPPVAQS